MLIIVTAIHFTGCKKPSREEVEFQNTKKCAEAGSYMSLLNLGILYEKGVGVRKDEKMAIECYRRGLELIWEEQRKLPTTIDGWKLLANESPSNNRLKLLIGAYYEGMLDRRYSDIHIDGTQSNGALDTKEAIRWYKQITEENSWSSVCAEAHVRLAALSENGKAHRNHLEEASRRGSAEAKAKLSDVYLYDNNKNVSYEDGRRITLLGETKPNNNTIEFIHGIRLLEEAADIGGSNAATMLNWLHNNYEGKYPIKKDEVKAWIYERLEDEHRSAADECKIWFLGLGMSFCQSSMLPYMEEGTSEAFLWRLRALSGDARALYALSVYFAHGKVFAKDTAESIRLLKLSASLGDSLALISLGNRYYDGNGVIKDEIEAYACWNLAGCESKRAHEYIVKMERHMTEEGRLSAQKRTRELQTEIDKNKATVSRK
jgi:TPR repeat protein